MESPEKDRQNKIHNVEDPAAFEVQRGLLVGLERREVEKRRKVSGSRLPLSFMSLEYMISMSIL